MGKDAWISRSGAAALFALALLALSSPIAASARSSRPRSGSLTVLTSGLPRGQVAQIVVSGPRLHRRIGRVSRTPLRGLRPGRYVFLVQRVRVSRAFGHVLQGAVAYPARARVVVHMRAGRHATVHLRYAGIVNPRVRRLSARVLGVIGSAANPQAIVVPRGRAPSAGTILMSAPTAKLPHGLVARVTGAHRQGRWLIVSLVPVPVSAATPEVAYLGALDLKPSGDAQQGLGSTLARPADTSCSPPKLLKFGAHLDQVEVRQAFLGAWPPQFRLTLAVRTTESLGLGIAAVGINCDWSFGNIGPFQGGIPVGPVVVPVFLQLPVTAGIHVNGRLDAATVHFASTTVAHVAAGFDENAASLSEQGSNVWVDGALALQGSADLRFMIGVQGGIGVAKGFNVHVAAGFGPEFAWSSGHECRLVMNMGKLSAGVRVVGKDLDTPGWTPFKIPMWTGCEGPSSTGGSSPTGGGGGTPTGGGTPISGGGGTPTGPPVGASVTLAQGPAAPAGYRYAITLNHFAPGATVGITCYDSVSPGGFYSFSLRTDGSGNAYTASYCYSGDGPDHWVIAGGIQSNHVSWGGGSPPQQQAFNETVGGVTHTWTNYTNAGGTQGQSIAAYQTVQVACKITGFQVKDGDTWWYRIASSPWNNQFYASADAFYNNGQTSGSLIGTPFVDSNVPNC